MEKWEDIFCVPDFPDGLFVTHESLERYGLELMQTGANTRRELAQVRIAEDGSQNEPYQITFHEKGRAKM
jgi:hypothetical protein